MLFDDFYEKNQKERRRHWKSVSAKFALLIVNIIAVSGLYSIYDDYKTERDDKIQRINYVDELCRNLPKPSLFNFVKREPPTIYDNKATEVIYHYQTERSFEDVMPTFIEWFDSNSWLRRNPSNKFIFIKSRQNITIASDDNFLSHYNIHCYEEAISFGIYD
jgi:hypothetical protein